MNDFYFIQRSILVMKILAIVATVTLSLFLQAMQHDQESNRQLMIVAEGLLKTFEKRGTPANQPVVFKILHSFLPIEVQLNYIKMFDSKIKEQINAVDHDGYTPLLYVCKGIYKNKEEQTQLAKMLIDLGANVNAQTPYGNTPLHLAIGKRNISLIRFICKRNPNHIAANNKGDTPFEFATKFKNPQKILRILAPRTGEFCNN